MALFFQGNKPAVEWDGKKQAAKFQFIRRFLKTDDSKLIKLLIDLGYERVDEDDLEDNERTKLGNIKGSSTAAPPSKKTKKASLDNRVRRKNPPKL